ncbi:long-chain-fatty-acid--CoA ligase [Bermanella marisrubri]|uniref:Acyl-CoA synthase n=1 Tax=Bermanella marisrubri TaxID=207949 RepID=Q1N5G5_9GAMM|nr:long-chain-fatty-acid--CoA ligase [Bermanella marisrubri]EAT13977.1 acyl-CoA synthase [Oceanobacter sp. RED65] [Bermanella marisrubri]QIZ84725.1 long-chain-fatty-acid--CoA ligase [Bermanella marisrubri]
MFGQMQDSPLLVSQLIDHAAKVHGHQQIVTKTVEGHWHEYTFKDAQKRSKQLAQALLKLGIKDGDVIGTLAWNTHRHYECWYGISGMGAILHTINPRLFPEQLIYIINHAEDQYLFLDTTFVPLVEALLEHIGKVKGFVIMTDEAHMPETKLPNVHCYESLINAEDGDYVWPELDERQATSICYTSGTTGNPKGVVYSHRSSLLHSWGIAGKEIAELDNNTRVLPIVPMFHANAWGLVYATAMMGAKVVLPGPHLDGASVCDMINRYDVNISAAVPTVWTMLMKHLEESGDKLPSLDSVLIGGSAVPRSMIQKFHQDYDVDVWQAWGMTEMSPLGSLNKPRPEDLKLSYEEQLDIKVKQGRPCFGVEMKIVDDQNNELPHDGKAFGRLLVRGPWIIKRYFKAQEDATDAEGWFDTGDVATIDASSNMQITDRSKDVIKSGGEWISSIDLENAAMGHDAVLEAAVIGLSHPKWEERPFMAVVAKDPSNPPNPDDIRTYLESKVAKWWLPNAIEFVEEIPHTATGKINKVALREQFKDYELPDSVQR